MTRGTKQEVYVASSRADFSQFISDFDTKLTKPLSIVPVPKDQRSQSGDLFNSIGLIAVGSIIGMKKKLRGIILDGYTNISF